MRIRWKNLELPSNVDLDESTRTDRYACFTAEPFERGFGTTIGNSLRRVLLSSIEGTAVTALKIKDTKHEFSTIPGVVEDVSHIVLSVKQILVTMHTDKPKVLKLSVKKRKGPVTAADIETDSEAEIVNPELVLCTLADPIDLEMEFTVKKGRGYVTADENVAQEGGEREIGVMPVDSIFSPVRRVRYRAENTRVGKLTNYDKLILEVWTSGTVTPEHALVEASKILRKHLNAFVQYGTPGPELQQDATRVADEVGAIGVSPATENDELEDRLSMPIEELDLSVRALNCLESETIKTVRELVSRSEEELLTLRNFGRTTLKEIKKKIEDLGLSLGMLAETA
jgi:DNA-directed RNA polymerase subunit alpha